MEEKDVKENLEEATEEAKEEAAEEVKEETKEEVVEEVKEEKIEETKKEKKKKEKKPKKDRTYSIRGILRENKNVEWPSFKELMGQSGLVIGFTLLFGLYFFVCELAASGLINLIVGTN